MLFRVGRQTVAKEFFWILFYIKKLFSILLWEKTFMQAEESDHPLQKK